MAKEKSKSKAKAKTGFDLTEVKKMDIEALKNQSLDLHKEEFNLLMQLKTNQLQNTAEIRRVRRNIARIKTILNQKLHHSSDDKAIEQEKNNLKEAN